MTWLPTLRVVTFATVSLFAAIVLSLSADLISLTEPLFYYKFSAFALATSAITLLTVVPMYALAPIRLLLDDVTLIPSRAGAIFSYIVVEIVWLSVLWVLWLSSGSYAAWTDNQIEAFYPAESSCNYHLILDNNIVNQGCSEIKSITAFSFLTWIILMVYTAILLFLGIRAQGRGNNVWTVSVREEAIFYPEAKSGGTPAQMQTMPTTVPQAYPPAPASVPVPTPGAIQV
ncbi:hypothetical protein EI94DRAFT_1796839 [Lactarius quietus]|nr:hypothetical protein EI94DRAFT_1796839 [Lactarius quietus]